MNKNKTDSTGFPVPSLLGKRVLVTGGALRLGEVICRSFAAHGASVIIHYFQSCEAAVSLRDTLPCSGPLQQHSVFPCDLADADAIKKMVHSLGAPDFLVNNAARWIRGPAEKGKLEEQFLVNFTAPCTLIRSFSRLCPPDGEFSAINILDAAILHSPVPSSPYEDSKLHLLRETLRLAHFLAPNTRVNAIAPGPVFPPRGLKTGGMKHILTSLPLRRQVLPEDIAEAAVFLASARSVTGAILPIDCGQSLSLQ